MAVFSISRQRGKLTKCSDLSPSTAAVCSPRLFLTLVRWCNGERHERAHRCYLVVRQQYHPYFFVVFPEHTKPSYQKPVNVTPPEAVRTYFLEDIDSRIHGRQCHEYDLIFDRVPSDLDLVLVCWIESVIAAGAEIAWFAFEGSFDFNHILAKDVAGQVFAVGNNQGIELAVEDVYRRAPDWADRLSDDLRDQLGL